MKKMILVFLLTFLTGCMIGPGPSDWILDLSNGYQLSRSNSRSIAIYNQDKGERTINPLIVAFKNNKRFIAVKKIKKPDDSRERLDYDTMEYILLDMEENIVYESYKTEKELNNKISDLGIENLSKWKKTSTIPKGAK